MARDPRNERDTGDFLDTAPALRPFFTEAVKRGVIGHRRLTGAGAVAPVVCAIMPPRRAAQRER